MSVVKYGILACVVLLVVPGVISLLERSKPLIPLVADDGGACVISPGGAECTEPFGRVLGEMAREYGRNVWMLVKPTITIMLLASLASAAMLVLIPWDTLLDRPTPLSMGLVSLISVAMPVPIALDVMFAAQLQRQGVAPGYVMLFFITLGTYSVIPSIYLWRDVSKRLSATLFAFFVLVGWAVALAF